MCTDEKEFKGRGRGAWDGWRVGGHD